MGQELNKIGIEVLRIVSIRDREEEILRYAKEQRPMVIIMGTRGKNQKDIDLIGSVTAVSYTHLMCIRDSSMSVDCRSCRIVGYDT